MKNYYWFVNLDERGEFYADVRDEEGKTKYEVKSDDDNGEIFEVESGYMTDIGDLNGLNDYLQSLEILPPDSVILDGIKGGK